MCCAVVLPGGSAGRDLRAFQVCLSHVFGWKWTQLIQDTEVYQGLESTFF